MTLDHLSCGTLELHATQKLYEAKLKRAAILIICFFDFAGVCSLAFMQWVNIPDVPDHFDAGINRGLGLLLGTFHFAFRYEDEVALEARRSELIASDAEQHNR